MQLAIYRAVTHTMYPEESIEYHYSFHPIHAVEHDRDGHLLDWTDDSGPQPYAVIEVPDSAQIDQDEDGWFLLIPDNELEIAVEHVFELAMDRAHGLTVVEVFHAEVQRRS